MSQGGEGVTETRIVSKELKRFVPIMNKQLNKINTLTYKCDIFMIIL